MITTFQAFRLALPLKTPVVLTDFAPTLDALVYEALSQRSPAASREELLQEMRTYLQFNEQYGVFHASAMRFGLTLQRGLTAATYVRTDRHTPEKLSSEMFAPNGARGKYTRLQLAGGPTKNRLREMPAYSAPYAVFDGFGNPYAIKSLLEFFVLGIGYDAQNRQMGAFDDVHIAPDLEEDSSLLLSDTANRPLPASSGVKGVPGLSPLLPPYYLPEKQSVVTPQRVRSELISNLINNLI